MTKEKRSRSFYDATAPVPCDTCRLHRGCAENQLACRAMVDYANYGTTKHKPSLPTRDYWIALQQGGSAMLSRAIAREKRYMKRAQMTRKSNTQTTEHAHG